MASTADIPSEVAKRCEATKLKVGDVYSRHSFGKIISIDTFRGMATIENSNGSKWDIGLGVLELEFTIAGQFEGEESLSRTALIELLRNYPRTAMTVNFDKSVKPADNADELLEVIKKAIADGKAPTKKSLTKLAADQQTGKNRTMIGFHNNGYDEHGRLKFQEAGIGQRLIDPRTIRWAVVNGVKYVVK